MNRLQAGERLAVGHSVHIGGMRGTVTGHVEPLSFHQVVAHKVKLIERWKHKYGNQGVWLALEKPVVKICNYSFISYETTTAQL